MGWWAQSNEEPAWLPAAIWAGIIIAAAVVWYVRRRGERKQLRRLTEELGGEFVSPFLKGAYLSLRQEEPERRVRLAPRTRYTPPFLIVENLAPLGFRLRVDAKVHWYKRQTFFFDRLQKFSPGDPTFDQTYLARTDDPTRAQAWLNDHRRREALDSLFQNGFTALIADQKTVQLKMPNYKEIDLSAAKVRDYLAQMQQLAAP